MRAFTLVHSCSPSFVHVHSHSHSFALVCPRLPSSALVCPLVRGWSCSFTLVCSDLPWFALARPGSFSFAPAHIGSPWVALVHVGSPLFALVCLHLLSFAFLALVRLHPPTPALSALPHPIHCSALFTPCTLTRPRSLRFVAGISGCLRVFQNPHVSFQVLAESEEVPLQCLLTRRSFIRPLTRLELSV